MVDDAARESCAAEGNGYGSIDSTKVTPLPTEVDEEEAAGRRRSVVFACFLCLVAIGEGYDIGILNGAVVRVKDVFQCSTLEISLIVTVTPTCVMPGSLFGGAFADYAGRWGATLLTCFVLAVSPVAMALSQSVPMLICTRGGVGFGIGMGYVVVSTYIAEVAPTAIRGRLTALTAVFLNLGILFGYLVNWWLLGTKDDWRWMFALGGVLPSMLIVLLFLPQMTESPRWLFTQGREAEAEGVLGQFVGRAQAALDLDAMRSQAKLGAEDSLVSWAELFRAFGTPGNVRRMLVAGIVVGVSQLLCGFLPVAYYSSTLLKASAGERMAFAATIAMGAVKLVTVIIASSVLDRFGRRPMLLASGCLTAVACVWIAVAFALQTHWMWQALGFMLFMAGYEIGLGPVTFVYVAEISVTAWRAKSSGLAICISRVVGSIHLFFFPLVVDAMGTSTTFAIQSALCLAVTSAMWAIVFETQGKALEGMGELFGDTAKADV